MDIFNDELEKMNNDNNNEEKKKKREAARKAYWIKLAKKTLLGLFVLGIWCGIIYGSGYYAKQYIDQSILNVQQTNAMHIKELEDRINGLSVEIKEIKDILQETDKVLEGSETTQQALNEKIEELDRQLKELEKSLQLLKEAP